jgi:hypothetical protein
VLDDLVVPEAIDSADLVVEFLAVRPRGPFAVRDEATRRSAILAGEFGGDTMIRAALVAIILVMLSGAATGQEARPGQPGWTTTAEGCRVWNGAPQPEERATWSGGCVDGLADGRGVLRWTLRSGDETYDGEMSKGRPSGRGTYSWNDGERYDGEWRDGDMHGRGVYTWSDGSRYEGDFRDDKQNGRGIYVWANGDRYEGEWRDDDKHGRGLFKWSNGDRYDGEWRDNRMHGRGTFVAAEGDRYDGDWKDDKRHGQGKEVIVGHGVYEGAFADDLPNGMGTFTNVRNEVFSGGWTNGCFRQGDRWAHVAVTAEVCGFK